MDRDRFHNQLALSIGYKLINDKRFTLEVEDSDDPWVTLKVLGLDDIRFKASDVTECVGLEGQNEIKEIVDAVHQAFLKTIIRRFN